MPKQAAVLYEKILEIQVSKEMIPSLDRVQTHSNLLTVYAVLDEYDKAIVNAKKSSEILKKHYPDQGSAIYSAMNNIATIYVGLGRNKEAEATYEHILMLSESVLNARPQSIAATYHNLGGLYFRLDKFKESEIMLLKALSMKQKIFGVEHKEAGLTLAALSQLYSKIGQSEKAKELEENSFKILGYDPLAE